MDGLLTQLEDVEKLALCPNCVKKINIRLNRLVDEFLTMFTRLPLEQVTLGAVGFQKTLQMVQILNKLIEGDRLTADALMEEYKKTIQENNAA